MSGIKLQELLGFLNEYLKIDEFKDYCPNGLQVRGQEDIKKIAFSTTASMEMIQQAVDKQASTLIVHHGLFWDKEPKVLDGPLYKKVKLLMDHNISLIAYHLPLDAHKEVGNNAVILKALGADQIETFEHIGARGKIYTTKDALIKALNQMFDLQIKTPPCDLARISHIACVSGGGHSYFKAANEQNIEAFISGTQDEWVWDYAQENGKLFIPLGHYKSETLGIKALSELVKRKWKVEVIYLESQNPY